MRMALWIVTGGCAIAALVFARWWWLSHEDRVTPHWLAQHGLYDQPPRYDPDDPSRLHLLRKIARAQHDRDILGPER
jgi:hypothetical protein